MISLVDPSELENVLRPTVYRPVITSDVTVITSEARDLALRNANGEIPRHSAPRDDIKKTRPDQTAESRRY